MFQRSFNHRSNDRDQSDQSNDRDQSDQSVNEHYDREKYDREKSNNERYYREKYDREKYDREKYDRNQSDSENDSLSPLERSSEIEDESEEDIHLNRIYLENVRIPSNVLIVGPKKSGKSMLIKYVLNNIKDSLIVDSCIVTADTKEYDSLELNDNWDVISSYDHDLSMGELNNYSVRFIEDWSGKRNNVFDLFQDKRSFNVIAIDRYSHLPSSIRQQVDYVILLGNIKELREIWFDFAGIVPHYSDFRLIYDDCTSGYDFLVIDNFGTSKKIIDHIRWGRIKIQEQKINKHSTTAHSNTTHSSTKRPATPFRPTNSRILSNENPQNENPQNETPQNETQPNKKSVVLEIKEMPRLSISAKQPSEINQSITQPPTTPSTTQPPTTQPPTPLNALNSRQPSRQTSRQPSRQPSRVTFSNQETRRFSVKMPPSTQTISSQTISSQTNDTIESINDKLNDENMNEQTTNEQITNDQITNDQITNDQSNDQTTNEQITSENTEECIIL